MPKKEDRSVVNNGIIQGDVTTGDKKITPPTEGSKIPLYAALISGTVIALGTIIAKII